MSQQANLLTVQRNTHRIVHNLTKLQLCCEDMVWSTRLPELVAALSANARRLDELEVMSAGTPFNDLIEQANRYTTLLLALLALLATNPNTLAPAELGTLLTPAIRLLTKAEGERQPEEVAV